MPSFRSSLSTCAAAAVLLPATAPAAPTVTFEPSCVGESFVIGETGAGFGAGAQVFDLLSVQTDDSAATPLGTYDLPVATADASGAYARALRAPSLKRSQDWSEIVTVSATDQADPMNPALTQFKLSAWYGDIPEWRKGKVDPRGKLTLTTTGWSGLDVGGTLYLHYFKGGKEVAKQVAGRATGECGDLMGHRLTQFPKGKAKAGKYTVALTDKAHLDRKTDAWIGFKVTVPASKATQH